MKVIDVAQGSVEWTKARLGIPTASNFDNILTPTGKPSGSVDRYMAALLSEWFFGIPSSDFESPTMARGSKLEKEAIGWYEWEKDVDTQPVGLCVTDDGRAGASPDRLVGDDGTTEVKCPLAETQMLYWLNGRPKEHKVQRQGQLWVTGRQWSDLVVWHPVKSLRRIVRDHRDEEFIKALAEAVTAFCDRLDDAKAKLRGDKAEYDEQEAEKNEIPACLTP